jgi:hypothetical protein
MADKFKTVSLDTLIDKYLGKLGTKIVTLSKTNCELICWDKPLNRLDKIGI